MSLVLTKQTFTDETNNTNWLRKAMVLFSALFLVGCSCCCYTDGGDNNSSFTINKNKSIVAAFDQSFILENGKVYAAGRNGEGHLGMGDNTNCNIFKEVSSLSDKNITAVASGYIHTFMLSDDGKTYSAGFNDNGQLGLGDTDGRNVFTEVPFSNGITAIAAGDYNAFIFADDGKIYAIGDNFRGQLGLGDYDDRKVFTEISSLNNKNITAVAAGSSNSFALSNDGRVYTAGANYFGELGMGDTNSRNIFTEVPFLNDKNITAIVMGEYYSLVLSHEGKVYGAGKNNDGQLGLGDTIDRNIFTEIPFLSDKNIIAIAAGNFHSLALSDTGKVYVTGSNNYGQLGLGDNTNRNTFTEIPFLSDKNITAVAAGRDHSFVLSCDGKVYTAGGNYNGQLGLGDNTDRNVFTEVTTMP